MNKLIIIFIIFLVSCGHHYPRNLDVHNSNNYDYKINQEILNNNFDIMHQYSIDVQKAYYQILKEVYISLDLAKEYYFYNRSITDLKLNNYLYQNISKPRIIDQIVNFLYTNKISSVAEYHHRIRLNKLALLESHYLINQFPTEFYLNDPFINNDVNNQKIDSVIYIGEDLKYHFDRHKNSKYQLIYYNYFTIVSEQKIFYLNYYFTFDRDHQAHLLKIDFSDDLNHSSVFSFEGEEE